MNNEVRKGKIEGRKGLERGASIDASFAVVGIEYIKLDPM